MFNTAVIVPTIRDIDAFVSSWMGLLSHVEFIVIWDGDHPRLSYQGKSYYAEDFMGKYADTICNRSASVRNLGFAYVSKFLPDVEYIMTTDDDVTPVGNPIQDHIDALNMKVPVSWMRVGDEYTRGFPYGIREEAQVMLSHGVWKGEPDHDAPTQLVKGLKEMEFYKMPIPKGVYYPMSGMNVAFRREFLPHMYFAPTGGIEGVDRLGDIWAGIITKDIIDKNGWAVVTGYSTGYHTKAF